MEEQNQDSSLFEMSVDENAREQLSDLSRWALILVITSIISIVLSIIEAFVPKKETVEYGSLQFQVEKSPNTGSMIVGIILSAVLAWLLYQFCVFTKRGVENLNQAELNKGLSSLKTYFMVSGIIIIIVMSLILIALLAGGTVSMSM